MLKPWALFFLILTTVKPIYSEALESLDQNEKMSSINYEKEIVQLLFQIGSESFTSIDESDFKTVTDSIEKFCPQNKFFGKYNSKSQFLLNQIINFEVNALEISADKDKLSQAIQSVKSNASIVGGPEKVIPIVKSYCKVSQMLNIKQNILKSDLELKNWINVLKRKYSVRYKSAEFQKNINEEFR